MKKGKEKAMQSCDNCRWYRKDEVIECFCFDSEDWRPYPDGRCCQYDDGSETMKKNIPTRKTRRKEGESFEKV